MRKLIAAMKVSVDGKTEGPEGYADWVEDGPRMPCGASSADRSRGRAAR